MLIDELPGLFRSWWGVFGCTAPPAGFYLLYLALVLGGLAGLIADRHHPSFAIRNSQFAIRLLLAWLVLSGLAYVRWNWVIHAPKGRLLYPVMVSVAILLGRGWAYWVSHLRWLTTLLLVLLALSAVAVPFAVMAPPISPPPVYSTAVDVHPEHPLDGRFGSDIALLGYDLVGTALCPTSFEPGEWLDLTLYWQVLARPAAHYTLAIQLISAVPGETATLVNFNTWTGNGNYPTGVWHPGDVFADRYRLRLPDDVPRAQGWVLQAILYNNTDGTRLPFTLDDQPAGDAAWLTLLRVGASSPEESQDGQGLPTAALVQFGRAVALDGVRVTEEEEALDVTLWWRSVAPLADDFTVFVHLYSEGQLVATADGPPLSGGFPTSLWQPGDRVRDERLISFQPTNQLLQLGVGWYDPVTGVRLAATTTDDVRLLDDEALIPIER